MKRSSYSNLIIMCSRRVLLRLAIDGLQKAAVFRKSKTKTKRSYMYRFEVWILIKGRNNFELVFCFHFMSYIYKPHYCHTFLYYCFPHAKIYQKCIQINFTNNRLSKILNCLKYVSCQYQYRKVIWPET